MKICKKCRHNERHCVQKCPLPPDYERNKRRRRLHGVVRSSKKIIIENLDEYNRIYNLIFSNDSNKTDLYIYEDDVEPIDVSDDADDAIIVPLRNTISTSLLYKRPSSETTTTTTKKRKKKPKPRKRKTCHCCDRKSAIYVNEQCKSCELYYCNECLRKHSMNDLNDKPCPKCCDLCICTRCRKTRLEKKGERIPFRSCVLCKSLEDLNYCSTTSFWVNCEKIFCTGCLKHKYNDVPPTNMNDLCDWKCPVCRGLHQSSIMK